MSAPAFAGLKHLPTAVYLPACRYGCGEMLLTDEGYMCPICGYFKSYSRPRKVRLGAVIGAGWGE